MREVGVFLLVSFGAAMLLDCIVAATGGLGTLQAKGILPLRTFTWVVGIVLFTCLCAGLGVLLSWLRVRSGSVVPAAITHAAFNAFGGLPAMLVAPGDGLDLVLVAPGDGLDLVLVGLIGWPAVVLFGLLATLLLSGSWAGRSGAGQGTLP